MRPALKLLFLWLILVIVHLGGLHQAMSASWGGPGGEPLVSFSRSRGAEDPNRQQAPTLRLLAYGCVPCSSRDRPIKVRLRSLARLQLLILRQAVEPPSRTAFGPRDSGRSERAWSTGPPA